MFKFLSKDRISQLPKKPGVYCFKNRKREILYIGKAADIRERVKNHFSQPAYRDNLFIGQVSKIGYLKTNSEIEALILEANLIKKYQPKYNIVWRDDKNYFYVGITKEPFPRIFITHQPKAMLQKIKMQNAKFIGPFVDGNSLKATLKILRKVFPYRSCNKLPKRPCLWYQLKRCPAPCILKSNLAKQIPNLESKVKKECQKNAKNIIKFLESGRFRIIKELKKEMKKASSEEDFEKAVKIRDQIEALEKVLTHAKIFLEPTVPQTSLWYYKEIEEGLKELLKIKKRISRIEAYDVSNIQGNLATGSMVTFISGQPEKNFYRRFKIKINGKPNDIAMLKEILSRRFNHPEWPYPDLILIDGGKAQLSTAQLTVKNYQLTIPIIALAKKRSAGENKLFIEGRKKPILLKNLAREIFNLILQLRDEAHRFARKYHLKRREIDLFKNL